MWIKVNPTTSKQGLKGSNFHVISYGLNMLFAIILWEKHKNGLALSAHTISKHDLIVISHCIPSCNKNELPLHDHLYTLEYSYNHVFIYLPYWQNTKPVVVMVWCRLNGRESKEDYLREESPWKNTHIMHSCGSVTNTYTTHIFISEKRLHQDWRSPLSSLRKTGRG
jgi:hypothetical protein